jgi:predicted O-methyltransferase YrrM
VSEKRICLNRAVLAFMAAQITPQSFVLEFGAGWSSRWFAERCGRLVSIETSPEWAEIARQDLVGSICDWTVRLVKKPDDALAGVSDVDLALIDGIEEERELCARLAWPLLRSGGWLVLDDAQRAANVATIKWLNGQAKPRRLTWNEGDVETAKARIALAWQRGQA